MKAFAVLTTRTEDSVKELKSSKKKEQIYEAIDKFDLKDKKVCIYYTLIYNKYKKNELTRVIHLREVGDFYGI